MPVAHRCIRSLFKAVAGKCGDSGGVEGNEGAQQRRRTPSGTLETIAASIFSEICVARRRRRQTSTGVRYGVRHVTRSVARVKAVRTASLTAPLRSCHWSVGRRGFLKGI